MAALDKCPVCGNLSFSEAELSVNVIETLLRWEKIVGRPLPDAVLTDYRQYADKPLVLKKCGECGFGLFSPVVAGSASFYQYISAVDYYNDEKWEFGASSVQLQSVGAKRILDVGCGSGMFLDFLQRQIPSAQLVGYDLNVELLADLPARGHGVLTGDLSQVKELVKQVEPFDAICMLQVLEHASDPIDMLQTFLALLRPGGLLVITTPNASGPIKNFPDALTELPPHHVTRWTEETFKVLFQRFNLNMTSVQHEPLPDYLWDAYLPVMWDEPIWPTLIFDSLARRLGMVTVGERSGFAATEMKEAGIRWLYGVPSHTILVAATLERG